MITHKFGIGIVAALLMIGCVSCGGSSGNSAADQHKKSTEATSGQNAQSNTTDNAGGDASTIGDNDSGGTKTVPNGWPEYLAVPDGFTIQTSQSRTMSDGRALSRVEAIGEGDLEEIFDTYEKAVIAAGYKIGFKNDLNDVYHLNADGDDWEVEVVVEESTRSPGNASVVLKYMSKQKSDS